MIVSGLENCIRRVIDFVSSVSSLEEEVKREHTGRYNSITEANSLDVIVKASNEVCLTVGSRPVCSWYLQCSNGFDMGDRLIEWPMKNLGKNLISHLSKYSGKNEQGFSIPNILWQMQPIRVAIPMRFNYETCINVFHFLVLQL